MVITAPPLLTETKRPRRFYDTNTTGTTATVSRNARVIYLHRVPLQQSLLRMELMTHEAVQVGDLVHDFGTDSTGVMGYSSIRFNDWVKIYPVGKRCQVGKTSKSDEEIIAEATSSSGAEYRLWDHNCQHISRKLIRTISDGYPQFPDEPIENSKNAFKWYSSTYLAKTRTNVTGSPLLDFFGKTAASAALAVLTPGKGGEGESEWEHRQGRVITGNVGGGYSSLTIQ